MAPGSDRDRSRWNRYWRVLTSRRGVDDEVAFHLEMRTSELFARRAARLDPVKAMPSGS